MNKYSDKIVITTGDPNGIGAEITIKALRKLNLPSDKVVLISNRKILEFYLEDKKVRGLEDKPVSDCRKSGGMEVWQEEQRTGGQEDRLFNVNSFSETVQQQQTDNDLFAYSPIRSFTDNSLSSNPRTLPPSAYELIEIPYDAEIEPGKVTKEAGEFSFQSVKKACEIGAKAIVTAPVAKNAMHLAGHNFNGQTEILQKYLAHDNQLAEMLFVADNFRVLLLTRHVPLKEINLTKELVVEKILNLKKFFVEHLGIIEPKFALCGFNPHSGEGGILGREEIEILQPAVEELRAKGVNITNPLPADTLFTTFAKEYIESLTDAKMHRGKEAKQINNNDAREVQLQTNTSYASIHTDAYASKKVFRSSQMYDCYIANYHDQGLIPIKTVAGDKTVNMTIGLDIIRTSPGHGTAFDIAGKNLADETGMIEAIKAVL